jgi:hypothetical protein
LDGSIQRICAEKYGKGKTMKRDNWYPKGQLQKPFVPMSVEDVQLAFPAQVAPLMPPVEDIPEEFADYDNDWNRFVKDWFYQGIAGDKFPLEPKENVDILAAVRHVVTILRSFEPKHEYKLAATAYLLSIWFENPWEKSS